MTTIYFIIAWMNVFSYFIGSEYCFPNSSVSFFYLNSSVQFGLPATNSFCRKITLFSPIIIHKNLQHCYP